MGWAAVRAGGRCCSREAGMKHRALELQDAGKSVSAAGQRPRR